LRKSLYEVEDGTNDLMQCREGEVRFRLDATPTKDAHISGLLARDLQEGRLTDAGLSRDDQRGAP
jgi:hypothetical protein